MGFQNMGTCCPKSGSLCRCPPWENCTSRHNDLVSYIQYNSQHPRHQLQFSCPVPFIRTKMQQEGEVFPGWQPGFATPFPLSSPSPCSAHALTPAGLPAPLLQNSLRGFHFPLMKKTKPKIEALCTARRRFFLPDSTEPPEVLVPGQHGGPDLEQAPSE